VLVVVSFSNFDSDTRTRTLFCTWGKFPVEVWIKEKSGNWDENYAHLLILSKAGRDFHSEGRLLLSLQSFDRYWDIGRRDSDILDHGELSEGMKSMKSNSKSFHSLLSRSYFPFFSLARVYVYQILIWELECSNRERGKVRKEWRR